MIYLYYLNYFLDPKIKQWNFHINDYMLLNEKIINLNSEIFFNGLPNFVYKVFE